VVNNPILLVHQTLVLMREGLGRREAIEQSLSSRIRPILMTTMTTIFGLAPLVFFPGAGSELYRGLGAVVFGGLLLSTVLTLVFIPVLLNLSLMISEWSTGRAVTKSFSSEEAAADGPIATPSGKEAAAPVYEPPRTVAATGEGLS
jgi:HAE1 family hydrophobic/amphiphilic exporter-1